VRNGRPRLEWGRGTQQGSVGVGDARSRQGHIRTNAPDSEGHDQSWLLGPGILEEGGDSWRGVRWVNGGDL
jgi:hypothetical protein